MSPTQAQRQGHVGKSLLKTMGVFADSYARRECAMMEKQRPHDDPFDQERRPGYDEKSFMDKIVETTTKRSGPHDAFLGGMNDFEELKSTFRFGGRKRQKL